jgi:hypothetical protein
MVNDDKPFLKITSSGVLAYGSPWGGKHGLASNVCVPLQGICLLRRGNENVIDRIEPERCMQTLCHQAHASVDASLEQHTVALVRTLTQKVSLWEMYCNKEPNAALVSYMAMSRDDK